jgi:glycosyltransferase involved in cell wall biosynthesis
VGYKVGIILSHPIQYYSPWFRYLSKQLDIEVFYAHNQSSIDNASSGFKTEFQWDIDLFDGYKYRWLNNIARKPGINSFFGCDTPEIDEIIKRSKFDAFLVCGWNYKAYIQAIIASKKNNVPVIIRGDSNLISGRSHIINIARFIPYRILLPLIDAYLYVGKLNKEYLLYYGVDQKKIFFSPHFIDNELFTRSAQEAIDSGRAADLRGELGISNDSFVFLFAGKLLERKRPQDFIMAFMELINKRDDNKIHAIIAGDGPLRRELELLSKRHSSCIHFLGFCNQSKMPAIYKSSNILVLPSIFGETWGLVVNEAFACGIPAIVSDRCGCAPDLIDEGVTGFTFKAGDRDSLCEIMSLARDCYHARNFVEPLGAKLKNYSLEKASIGFLEALGATHNKG